MSHPAREKLPDLRSLSDEELLRVAQGEGHDAAGHPAASELLSRYQRQVYLWCHRMVRDHERALDLSQDVLLSAYRNLHRFGGRSRVGSWLFVIARNHCLNELGRVSLLQAPEDELENLGDGERNPEEALLDQEDEERLLQLIREHLEPMEQRALWLRCFEKMPVDAITEVLAIEESSGARAVLQRARRKLRAALNRAEQGDA